MRLTMIVGFPRSGTSLVSNILAEDVFYGGEPDQIRSEPENTFESDLVVSINEHLLSLFNINWLDPDHVEKVTQIDWQDPAIRSRYQRYMAQAQLVINSLIRQIKGKDGKTSIYWKDPRTSILLPFWLQAIKYGNRDHIFDEVIDVVNVIWCFRNIDESVDSAVDLFNDSDLSREQFLKSWELYNGAIATILAANKLPFFMINYADILKNPKKVIDQLFKFLGEDASKSRIADAAALVNTELHTFKAGKKKSSSSLYLRLIELCSKQTS